MTDERIARINVALPRSLRSAIKGLAYSNEMTSQDWIVRALRQALRRATKKAQAKAQLHAQGPTPTNGGK